jgi:hypothetical protein
VKRPIAWVALIFAPLWCVACGNNLPPPHQWFESHSDRNNSGFNPIRTADAIAAVKKWSTAIGPLVFSTPVVGQDGTVYIGNAAGEAVGLNPNGTLRFRYHIGGSIVGPPAVDPTSGDVFFIVQNPVTQSDVGAFLYRLSPNGVTQTTSAENLNTTGAPQLWRDYVFVVGTGYLFVFDLGPPMRSAHLRWRRSIQFSMDSGGNRLVHRPGVACGVPCEARAWTIA